MLEIPTKQYALDNGLRVVLSEDHALPVVAVNLWYGVGSRNERKGRTGFAHLFEHMMFQGSAHAPKNKHFELIEKAGGSVNATTWFDRTNYFETLPSHYLDLALWLESDRLGWMLPAMTSEKLENQRGVVKNERMWRYDNQPYGDWDERILEMIFPEDHPYRHSVIGSMEDIEAATLGDVEDFFRTFYVPNNAVLTICGDFEERRAMDSVERFFGQIEQGEPPPPVPGNWEIPIPIGETRKLIVESEVPLPKVFMACRIPSYLDDSFTAAEVTSFVLGAGKSSRLYRSLVRERRVAKDIVCYAFPMITGSSIMMMWATGYPEVDVATLEEALVAELDGLNTVADVEVDRAIALVETALAQELESLGDRADLISKFALYFDDPGRINRELDRFRSVTTQDVRRFAETYLNDENRAVVSYVPGVAQ